MYGVVLLEAIMEWNGKDPKDFRFEKRDCFLLAPFCDGLKDIFLSVMHRLSVSWNYIPDRVLHRIGVTGRDEPRPHTHSETLLITDLPINITFYHTID